TMRFFLLRGQRFFRVLLQYAPPGFTSSKRPESSESTSPPRRVLHRCHRSFSLPPGPAMLPLRRLPYSRVPTPLPTEARGSSAPTLESGPEQLACRFSPRRQRRLAQIPCRNT